MEVPRGMEPTGTNGRTRHTFQPLFGGLGLVLWWFSRWMAGNAVSCGHDDDAGKAFIVRVRCPVPGPPRSESWLVPLPADPCGWPLCWFCGGHGPGETPGPFPNPEAKAWHGDGTALERVWESSAPPHSFVGGSRRASRSGNPLFLFVVPDFSGPSRTSRQRLSGSSKVFFRGLRPSRSSGPPGRASMTPRRVLLLSGAYRPRVAGDPFFSHDRSDWMVGCGSKLNASLFSNVVQDLQHSIAILLFADVACGMQYPDHFIPFRPHASQIFLGGVSESHQHRLATE